MKNFNFKRTDIFKINQNKYIILCYYIIFLFINFYFINLARASVVDLNIDEGYNFISFNVEPVVSADDIIKNNISVDDIYYYSTTAVNFLSAAAGELKTLYAGRGYIIKAGVKTNILLEGNEYKPSSLEIKLNTGFNLIGSALMPDNLKASDLMNKTALIKGIYKWNALSGSFLQVLRKADGAYELLDGIDFYLTNLTKNSAYFINTTGVLTLNCNENSISVTAGGPLLKVEKPVFTPASGTYESEISVVISSKTPTAIIKYTLDGSDPFLENSYFYTAPVIIKSNDTIIKACAKFSGMLDSECVSSEYYFKQSSYPAELVINADTFEIIADGSNSVVLTAELKDQYGKFINGYEIEFYVNTEKLTGSLFKTSVAGTYEIKAVAAGLTSNIIQIIARPAVEKYSISGKVIDETGAAVTGAAVRFNGGFSEVFTGSDGYFYKNDLYGSIEINVYRAGYIFKPAVYNVSGANDAANFKGMTSDFTPPVSRASGATPGGYGPWNLRLLSASSSDGLNFTKNSLVQLDQSDVPDIIIDTDGWIYLYYTCWTVGSEMNKTVAAISADNGSNWIYKKLNLSGFEGMASAVDPDIQILSDGTFRLYLTSAPVNQVPRTYYAEGNDGVKFVKGSDTPVFYQSGKDVMDPSTILIGDTWHYFAGGAVGGGEGSNWHAVSNDGKIFNYSGASVFSSNGKNFLVSNIIAVPGGYRFYGFNHTTPDEASVIGSFFTENGDAWIADTGYRITLDTVSAKESWSVKDPAVTKLLDNSYLMIYVTAIP